MAFIDKCTTMRRFAIINENNGNIAYEGVYIEGEYLYKSVGDDGVFLKNESPMDNWRYDDFVLVWEDEKCDKKWIPREDCDKEYYDDENFVYVNKED